MLSMKKFFLAFLIVFLLPLSAAQADRPFQPFTGSGSGGGGRRYLTFVISGSLSVGDGTGTKCSELPSGFNGLNVVEAVANVGTAGASGSANLFQIRNATDTQDLFSTKIMIDAGETTSTTAATPYVVDTAHDDMATADSLCVDVDQLNTTPPSDLKITLGFE